MSLTLKPNLHNLLTVMRRMHVAARDHQWDSVEELDQQRCHMLDCMPEVPDLNDSQSRAALSEIIELDQEVINEINRGMDLSALNTSSGPAANNLPF